MGYLDSAGCCEHGDEPSGFIGWMIKSLFQRRSCVVELVTESVNLLIGICQTALCLNKLSGILRCKRKHCHVCFNLHVFTYVFWEGFGMPTRKLSNNEHT